MTLLLRDVSKSFKTAAGTLPIITNMTTAFGANTSVAILGARGSGKSTLIRLLSGELAHDRGQIEKKCRVSFRVTSARMFHGAMTIEQNIKFISRAYRMNPKQICDFVAEFAELEHVMSKGINKISREERGRLLFTLPYAMPFDIYLCDEAIVGGAGKFREKCEQLVEARRRTCGLVFATKSPTYAKKFADQAVLLDAGALHIFDSIDAALKAFSRANQQHRELKGHRYKQDEGFFEESEEDERF